MDLTLILTTLCVPTIGCLAMALSVPYAFARSLVPLFGAFFFFVFLFFCFFFRWKTITIQETNKEKKKKSFTCLWNNHRVCCRTWIRHWKFDFASSLPISTWSCVAHWFLHISSAAIQTPLWTHQKWQVRDHLFCLHRSKLFFSFSFSAGKCFHRHLVCGSKV